MELALPFGSATGLDSIRFGAGKGGAAAAGNGVGVGGLPSAQFRLPFTDFKMPKIGALGRIFERPLYRVRPFHSRLDWATRACDVVLLRSTGLGRIRR